MALCVQQNQSRDFDSKVAAIFSLLLLLRLLPEPAFSSLPSVSGCVPSSCSFSVEDVWLTCCSCRSLKRNWCGNFPGDKSQLFRLPTAGLNRWMSSFTLHPSSASNLWPRLRQITETQLDQSHFTVGCLSSALPAFHMGLTFPLSFTESILCLKMNELTLMKEIT